MISDGSDNVTSELSLNSALIAFSENPKFEIFTFFRNVFSEYYKDQTQKFLDGEFVKMKLNQEEIEKSENVLILKPKG